MQVRGRQTVASARLSIFHHHEQPEQEQPIERGARFDFLVFIIVGWLFAADTAGKVSPTSVLYLPGRESDACRAIQIVCLESPRAPFSSLFFLVVQHETIECMN